MSHNASITLFMCDNCYWVTSQKSWQVGIFLVLCNMFLFIDTYRVLCNIRSTTGCETQAINMASYKFLWNHLLLPTQVWISIHTKNQWTSKNAGLDDIWQSSRIKNSFMTTTNPTHAIWYYEPNLFQKTSLFMHVLLWFKERTDSWRPRLTLQGSYKVSLSSWAYSEPAVLFWRGRGGS